MAASGPTVWFQTVLNVKPKSRGVHIITEEIESIAELKKYKIGLAHLLLQHTSASICVNECWDSSVRKDMEMMLNRLVPESGPPYKHTLEGPDDMPGEMFHILLKFSSGTNPGSLRGERVEILSL